MGKWVLFITLAIVVGAIGFTMFPSIKTVLSGTSTTGFSDLLKAMVACLPYAAAFFIFYAIWNAAHGKK